MDLRFASSLHRYRSTTSGQLVLFLMVGGLNTLLGYSLFAFFILIGLGVNSAVLLSTIVSLLFNFQMIRNIVFRNKSNYLFLRFNMAHFFLYFFNTNLIKLINFGLNDFYLSGFIAIFPVATLSFLLNKYVVFRGPDEIN